MPLSLSKTVSDFLRQHPEQKFKARQIAQWVFANFPAECQEKKENSKSISSDDALVQQLGAEIGSQRPKLQKKYPQIKTSEGRPRQYYWSEKSDQAQVHEAEQGAQAAPSVSQGAPRLKEADLYPLLTDYLWSDQSVFSKRIDEKKSSNKQGPNGNRWLFPDLVGMEDLTVGMHQEIKQIIAQYGDRKTRLWSFEVKMLLNRSNVREAYFQAVSNSSWANLGYLAAAEIEGPDTMKELRMLFGLHGIGFILINTENPAESEILIPARERIEVDWATCNRLASENKDFLQFVQLTRQFYQTGDPRQGDWDLPNAS